MTLAEYIETHDADYVMVDDSQEKLGEVRNLSLAILWFTTMVEMKKRGLVCEECADQAFVQMSKCDALTNVDCPPAAFGPVDGN